MHELIEFKRALSLSETDKPARVLFLTFLPTLVLGAARCWCMPQTSDGGSLSRKSTDGQCRKSTEAMPQRKSNGGCLPAFFAVLHVCRVLQLLLLGVAVVRGRGCCVLLTSVYVDSQQNKPRAMPCPPTPMPMPTPRPGGREGTTNSVDGPDQTPADMAYLALIRKWVLPLANQGGTEEGSALDGLYCRPSLVGWWVGQVRVTQPLTASNCQQPPTTASNRQQLPPHSA